MGSISPIGSLREKRSILSKVRVLSYIQSMLLGFSTERQKAWQVLKGGKFFPKTRV